MTAKRHARRSTVIEQRYTPAQVAERICVHRRTVLELVRAGAFPRASKPFANKVLIPAGDVELWLANHELRMPGND